MGFKTQKGFLFTGSGDGLKYVSGKRQSWYISEQGNPGATDSPVFQSAATNTDGTKVILTYNKALSSTTAATSAFAVVVNSSAATVSSAAVSGSTVELTMGTAITNGQTVTVAYTDPSGGEDANAVQDLAGNDAASLSATSVTNNVPSSSAVTLTAAEHYYDQGISQQGNPVDINVSADANANETWSDIAVASTSGKRLFVIIMSFRFTNATEGDWANRFQNNAAGLTLELSASGTTTALTYRGAYAASGYNSTSIWTAMVDGATTSTHDYEIELDDATSGALHGNFAYSGIVLDEVNTVEYLNIESLGFSGQANQSVTSALGLAPNNTTSATKVLRIAAANGSNITANDLDYNKGGSEPAYTQIGEGDNGTDERHYHAYHFGDHGTQVNMTGTFGNGSTTASNGISGLGCIIGLS